MPKATQVNGAKPEFKLRPFKQKILKNNNNNGASGWLSGLSVQPLVLAQIMISWFMRSSPASGSELTVRLLLGILSPSLSALPLHVLYLSLKINKNKLKKKGCKG